MHDSRKKWYFSIFKDGKYLDLWSLNHTLSGIVIAGPLYYLSVPFTYSFLIALVLIVGWEIYEIIFKINETWQNRSTDILTGVLGFLFLWHLFPSITTGSQVLVYASSLAVFIVLEVWGYLAYKSRAQ